ncbi:hypothetical protein EST38_g4791 [Candolleomyces aberdarensis]|uniref:Uncharacterized protein n=1 Tax=Candolleomyces aberdarensis TaxID=2316362 RepID=A0A4Q2DLR7_9AGAR|nr:hypothetical protein EST38_g4791 [Candolleomyces aberdarensis]
MASASSPPSSPSVPYVIPCSLTRRRRLSSVSQSPPASPLVPSTPPDVVAPLSLDTKQAHDAFEPELITDDATTPLSHWGLSRLVRFDNECVVIPESEWFPHCLDCDPDDPHGSHHSDRGRGLKAVFGLKKMKKVVMVNKSVSLPLWPAGGSSSRDDPDHGATTGESGTEDETTAAPSTPQRKVVRLNFKLPIPTFSPDRPLNTSRHPHLRSPSLEARPYALPHSNRGRKSSRSQSPPAHPTQPLSLSPILVHRAYTHSPVAQETNAHASASSLSVIPDHQPHPHTIPHHPHNALYTNPRDLSPSPPPPASRITAHIHSHSSSSGVHTQQSSTTSSSSGSINAETHTHINTHYAHTPNHDPHHQIHVHILPELVPLRPCCPDCTKTLEEALKKGEEWKEKFSRGAKRRRRRSSSVTSNGSVASIDGASLGSIDGVVAGGKARVEEEKSLPEVPVVVGHAVEKTVVVPVGSALKKHSSFSSFSTPMSSSIEETDEEHEGETEGETEAESEVDASATTKSGTSTPTATRSGTSTPTASRSGASTPTANGPASTKKLSMAVVDEVECLKRRRSGSVGMKTTEKTADKVPEKTKSAAQEEAEEVVKAAMIKPVPVVQRSAAAATTTTTIATTTTATATSPSKRTFLEIPSPSRPGAGTGTAVFHMHDRVPSGGSMSSVSSGSGNESAGSAHSRGSTGSAGSAGSRGSGRKGILKNGSGSGRSSPVDPSSTPTLPNANAGDSQATPTRPSLLPSATTDPGTPTTPKGTGAAGAAGTTTSSKRSKRHSYHGYPSSSKKYQDREREKETMENTLMNMKMGSSSSVQIQISSRARGSKGSSPPGSTSSCTSSGSSPLSSSPRKGTMIDMCGDVDSPRRRLYEREKRGGGEDVKDYFGKEGGGECRKVDEDDELLFPLPRSPRGSPGASPVGTPTPGTASDSEGTTTPRVSPYPLCSESSPRISPSGSSSSSSSPRVSPRGSMTRISPNSSSTRLSPKDSSRNSPRIKPSPLAVTSPITNSVASAGLGVVAVQGDIDGSGGDTDVEADDDGRSGSESEDGVLRGTVSITRRAVSPPPQVRPPAPTQSQAQSQAPQQVPVITRTRASLSPEEEKEESSVPVPLPEKRQRPSLHVRTMSEPAVAFGGSNKSKSTATAAEAKHQLKFPHIGLGSHRQSPPSSTSASPPAAGGRLSPTSPTAARLSTPGKSASLSPTARRVNAASAPSPTAPKQTRKTSSSFSAIGRNLRALSADVLKGVGSMGGMGGDVILCW